MKLASLVGAALFYSACATPVGVVRDSPQRVYQQLSASVLSTGEPSSFSVQVLRRLNLSERFDAEPEETLQQLHRGLVGRDDEDRLFALAELSLYYAEASGKRAYHLASAVYAYAFLFPESLAAPPNPADTRLRLALDIYNRAIAQGFASADGETVLFKAGRYTLPFGTLSVEARDSDVFWGGYRMTDFVAAANFAVRGLRNRYRHPGIGAPIIATLAPTERADSAGSRISARTKVAVTALLRFEDARQRLLKGELQGVLEIYPADLTAAIKIGGVEVPLESEITATIAHGLEGAPVWDFEIAGFRSGDFFSAGHERESCRRAVYKPAPPRRPHTGGFDSRHGIEPGALG